MKLKTLKKRKTKSWEEDPIYSSKWIKKFINKFMKQGRQTIAERAILRAFLDFKRRTHKAPITIFLNLIWKFRPVLSFIVKRKGKQFIDIPIVLKPKQQLIFSLKWIVTAIRMRRFSRLNTRIYTEFIENLKNKKTALLRNRDIFMERIFNSRLHTHFRKKKRKFIARQKKVSRTINNKNIKTQIFLNNINEKTKINLTNEKKRLYEETQNHIKERRKFWKDKALNRILWLKITRNKQKLMSLK